MELLGEQETHEESTARIVAQAATATAKAVFESAQAAAKVLAMENNNALTAIAVLQTEVTILKNQQTCFETAINKKMDDMSPKFEKIFDKLEEQAQLVMGRPSWFVSISIGALLSLCVGLIVYCVGK